MAIDILFVVAGKCGHGGLYDTTRHLSPTGGINKDTADKTLSPHHYLHYSVSTQAASLGVILLKNLGFLPISPIAVSFESRSIPLFPVHEIKKTSVYQHVTNGQTDRLTRLS